MHKFMWCRVQLLSYLEGGYLCWTMEVRRVDKSSLCSPRRINSSSRTWTRWCLMTHSSASFSSSIVKQPTRQLAFSRRLPRIRSSRRKGKWLIFLQRIAMNQATISFVTISIVTITKATGTIATIANLTIVIETINATTVLAVTTKTQRTASPTKRRWLQVQSFQEKETRPCTMTSHLCQVQEICPKKGVILSRFPLHSHSRSRSCPSSRSYNNHHVAQDNRKPSALAKCGYSYSSKSDDSRCSHHPDKSNTVFATISAPRMKKKSKHTQK